MHSNIIKIATMLALLATPMTGRCADSSYLMPDGRTLALPGGEKSFASRVVSAAPGDPPSTLGAPGALLGVPDFDANNALTYYSLGCRGEITVEFTANRPAVGPGPDLAVFEAGQAKEPVEVLISVDGYRWESLGVTQGGFALVDADKALPQGQEYGYVRLKDLGKACLGDRPGADLDAVAAIGEQRPPDWEQHAREIATPVVKPPEIIAPAKPVKAEPESPPKQEEKKVSDNVPAQISAADLFEYDKTTIKFDGFELLDRLLGGASETAEFVIILDAGKEGLSKDRAESVEAYLTKSGAKNIRTGSGDETAKTAGGGARFVINLEDVKK